MKATAAGHIVTFVSDTGSTYRSYYSLEGSPIRIERNVDTHWCKLGMTPENHLLATAAFRLVHWS